MHIDLRSDTVTRPTSEMRKVMAEAEVGDDVLGDDPSVRRLEEAVAARLGKAAACFVPSGTMANQCAIRATTEPGDEIIAHEGSHIIHYEGGGAAALSGASIRPLAGGRGMFSAAEVEGAVRSPDSHFPQSRLLVVENTHNRGGGSVWPLERVAEVCAAALGHGLRRHLDGARLWNACVASGRQPSEYAAHFDTVSVCFSKGLGAPVGSAVAGSVELIGRVRRFRKMFGGAMRQSGILAAAANHAMTRHYDRLAEDHANAKRLAGAIAEMRGARIEAGSVETNIVYFDLAEACPLDARGACEAMAKSGVHMLATGARRVRAVCHLDVSSAGIDGAIGVMRGLLG
jgi:threonine aldolase